MNPPKFYDARGRLTAYALGCGYVLEVETDQARVELYRQHGAYHVRRIDKVAKADPTAKMDDWRLWEAYDKLTEARAAFSRLAMLAEGGAS